MDKPVLTAIIMLIFIIIIIFILNIQKNNCIEKGGSVITDSLGFYEKCIYRG